VRQYSYQNNKSFRLGYETVICDVDSFLGERWADLAQVNFADGLEGDVLLVERSTRSTMRRHFVHWCEWGGSGRGMATDTKAKGGSSCDSSSLKEGGAAPSSPW
jgi:hypothetical protein